MIVNCTINVIDDFVAYHNDLDGESLLGLFADSHNQIKKQLKYHNSQSDFDHKTLHTQSRFQE